jgi:hypothetical protein
MVAVDQAQKTSIQTPIRFFFLSSHYSSAKKPLDRLFWARVTFFAAPASPSLDRPRGSARPRGLTHFFVARSFVFVCFPLFLF